MNEKQYVCWLFKLRRSIKEQTAGAKPPLAKMAPLYNINWHPICYCNKTARVARSMGAKYIANFFSVSTANCHFLLQCSSGELYILHTPSVPDPDARSGSVWFWASRIRIRIRLQNQIFSFSQESVEQTEIMVAIKLLIQKVSCYKFNFSHQTYFYSF